MCRWAFWRCLLNSGAADYVITGCGAGVPCWRLFLPGVICGHVEIWMPTPLPRSAATPSHSFRKGFGWGGDLNLEYIFEKLFCESRQGYQKTCCFRKTEQNLDQVKTITYRKLSEILKELEYGTGKRCLIKLNISRAVLFDFCKCEELAASRKKGTA